MNRVLVVEDNTVLNQYVCDSIKSTYTYWDVISAHNYKEATAAIDESIATAKPITLFLLDISLVTDDITDSGGFKIAEYIRSKRIYMKTPLMFLTQVDDKYKDALSKYHCYDYIKKPYTSDDILMHINQMLLMGYLKNSIVIYDTKRVRHIFTTDEVVYVEYLNHSLNIHTSTDEYVTRDYTMEMFEKLYGNDLLRCHRGFLVNPTFVISFSNHYISIKNDSFTIPIGGNYLKNVQQVLATKGITQCK